MAAGNWQICGPYVERLGLAQINNSTDSFVVRLYASTSNIAQSSDDASAVTNELSTANGYTAGGVSVTPTWTRSTNVSTLDISDPSWTASGGSIVARWAGLVDTTPATKRVVALMLLDSTPADVTTTSGNSLTIQINVNGVYQTANT